ncbi:MAG: hypothetical protein Q8Q40_12865 [Methylococcaceae bacterium]|nr:hypothetical protein [Methylococcaceae bacterium]MDP3904851.1 hypothetical protein [Methylococcaceae bacterium]
METLLMNGYRQADQADQADHLQSDRYHQVTQGINISSDALSLKSAEYVLPNGITLVAKNAQARSSNENTPLIFMAKFNVQFKADVNRITIDEFIVNNNARIISESKWAPNTFVLAVIQNQEIDTLSVATEFYDSGLTNFIAGLVQ